MAQLDLRRLMDLSLPVMEGFRRVEPRAWDRQAVLLELLGEIGSLAHVVQRREGYKRGGAPAGKLADECCDVIFVALRLAREDGLTLPNRLDVPDTPDAADALLRMARDMARIADGADAESLLNVIALAAAVGTEAGLDIPAAYEREMAIAMGFFAAAGERWPHPQPLRRPLATLKLWRLLWQRHSLPRK